MTRKILEYASHGEVTTSILKNDTKNGVKIVAAEYGPGMADIPQVMRDGCSSRKRNGHGSAGDQARDLAHTRYRTTTFTSFPGT
jgi:hypothetical protein